MHKITFFGRSVQKYYCYVQKNRLFWASCRNITGQEPGAPGFSCRANFGVREEILVFRRNIHLCLSSLYLQVFPISVARSSRKAMINLKYQNKYQRPLALPVPLTDWVSPICALGWGALLVREWRLHPHYVNPRGVPPAHQSALHPTTEHKLSKAVFPLIFKV